MRRLYQISRGIAYDCAAKKSGSDVASDPLFISIALFDLPVAYPLTLQLIGSWLCVPVYRFLAWCSITDASQSGRV
jgi:hypothetical protein